MTRQYVDLTTVKLFPDWPFPVGAERVPTLKAWWDSQLTKRSHEFPRLFGTKLEAVILRRLQESIGRGTGLPD